VRVDPSSIPNHIDVDVSALTIGRSIHVGGIVVPEGVEVLDDESATIATVAAPKTGEEAPAAEEAETSAEPEVIRKAKTEGEEGSE
jgi:large subunit ribosomal protein L25